MANTNQERLALSGLYGADWKARVAKMSDSQIHAIYMRFKSEGKIK